jgi:twitching motility protein PilT
VRGGRGHVLLVSERGVGRTELLAGVLREITGDKDRYVIVLDDAIDTEPPAGGALVARRRVGEHISGYVTGLRTAVREDPDAIVVGSVSEPEAFDMALRAAESGRLVVAWLDAGSVVACLDRILNFYRVYDVPRVRATLASVLRAICVRFLLPSRHENELVPATELLLVDDTARDVLRGGDLAQLALLMRLEGGSNGHSLDQSMFELITSGRVRIEDAYARAEDKGWLLDRSRGLIESEL